MAIMASSPEPESAFSRARLRVSVRVVAPKNDLSTATAFHYSLYADKTKSVGENYNM